MAKPDAANPDHVARTICLDFDGVLNQFKGWSGQYEDYDPLPGVDKFIHTLYSDGWRIVISTARPDISPVVAWLDNHNLMRYISEVTNQKPIALVYVDDRAVYFGGNYHVTLRAIRNMTPWYHKKVSFISKLQRFIVSFLEMINDFYDFPSTEDYDQIGF